MNRLFGCATIALLCLALTTGCKTTPIAESIDSGLKGIGRILSSPTAEVEKKIESDELLTAEELVYEKPEIFLSPDAQGHETTRKLVKAIINRYEQRLKEVTSSLVEHQNPSKDAIYQKTAREAFSQAIDLYGEIKDFKLLKREEYRSTTVHEFFQARKHFIDSWSEFYPKALIAHYTNAKDEFGNHYPLPRSHISISLRELLKEDTKTLPRIPIAGFKELFKSTNPSDTELIQFTKLLVDIDNKLPTIAFAADVAQSGGLSMDTFFREVVPIYLIPIEDKFGYADDQIKRSTKEALDSVRATHESFVLLPGKTEITQEVISKETRQSRYIVGYNKIPNPEYVAAMQALEHAQANMNVHELTSAGQPCYGWGCAAQAFAGLGYASQVSTAREQLAATPPTLEEPIYQEYQYSTAKVRLTKKVPVAAYLVADGHRSAAKLVFIASASKTFDIAFGVNDKDMETKNAFDSEDDIEPDNLHIDLNKELLAAIRRSSTALRIARIDEIIRPKQSPEYLRKVKYKKARSAIGATIPARERSVVVVISVAGSLGSGFYVSPRHILTNNHVVEDSKYVQLKDRLDREFSGEVVARDIGRDLALIKVSVAGKPVTLSTDIPRPGTIVEAIGHPKGLEFTISRGIVSAIRTLPSPYGSGNSAITVIQTDAAISPGNSGGPLFAGAKVIGVNTLKLVAEDTEGIGFAVHSTEIADFLSKAGL